MKCKKCGQYASEFLDESNHEFVYKTGYCRMCLIDFGNCD